MATFLARQCIEALTRYADPQASGARGGEGAGPPGPARGDAIVLRERPQGQREEAGRHGPPRAPAGGAP
eukprot:scaffold652024_cov42-Prasinocladus_malaysianus.AAC.1